MAAQVEFAIKNLCNINGGNKTNGGSEMDRSVNHERLPGETLTEYNARLEAETLAYKTTVNYGLFEIRHKLLDLKRWAVDPVTKLRVEIAFTALDGLVCQDFGEDENGCLITSNEECNEQH